MAGTSLLALIDDIATILDDVSVMTKIAAKKTSGVLGDDLALNAEQVSGIAAAREIPVVLKVAQGSLINKIILVPVAMALSAFLPVLIKPLLVLGGLFLCFEGFEKVFEKALQVFSKKSKPDVIHSIVSTESETEKIKGAVRTDFILSAEIIVITLGTVTEQPIMNQFLVLTSIALIMTFGVYGLVAGIVKLDDFGLFLTRKKNQSTQKFGDAILWAAPYLMKSLGVVGTIAMFLVGGGLISHSIPPLYHLLESFSGFQATLLEGVMGLLSGAAVAVLVHLALKLQNLFYKKI